MTDIVITHKVITQNECRTQQSTMSTLSYDSLISSSKSVDKEFQSYHTQGDNLCLPILRLGTPPSRNIPKHHQQLVSKSKPAMAYNRSKLMLYPSWRHVGATNDSCNDFFRELDRRITLVSDDVFESQYLFKRLSILIQSNDSTSLCCASPFHPSFELPRINGHYGCF
jgi:hypothetical protein